MNIQLIDFFKVATVSNKLEDCNKIKQLHKLALQQGYIIHPDCVTKDVYKWIQSKHTNYNSTFYKDWSAVISKSREELWMDQVINYAITYGFGQPFSLNDNDLLVIPNIENYTVILPISDNELINRCLNVVKEGIALKSDTCKVLCEEIVAGWENGVIDDIDIDSILNKEAQIILCDAIGELPDDRFALLRYIMYKCTGNPMIIKNRNTIRVIENADFDLGKLTVRQIHSLSTIFYRFKPIFLALKKQAHTRKFNYKNGVIVNRMRRLAKKTHTPLKDGYWETVVNKPGDLEELKMRIVEDNPSNFKLIRLLQSVRENKIMSDSETTHQLYTIRNGKIFVKPITNRYIGQGKREWWGILDQLFYKLIVKRIKDKACVVKFPQHLNLACPSSEKTFVGNIPYGSSYDLIDQNMFGIYWRGEWGTNDFDLSFNAFDGARFGWNSGFYSGKYDVIYSGDMTMADPEASEVIYVGKNCPDGVIKVSRYRGMENSKFVFALAQTDKKTSLPHGYMMNPNDIKFQSDMYSLKPEQMVGFISNKKLYICDFQTSQSRVACSSTCGFTSQDFQNILTRKMNITIDLKQLLLDAGFKEFGESDKNAEIGLDLTDLQKDTIINILK